MRYSIALAACLSAADLSHFPGPLEVSWRAFSSLE